jgi:CheY-like chemotaxis protein
MIEGDESQIYQVIMNCAVNAQHAMPRGGVLEIETYSEEIKEAIEMPHFTIEPGKYVMLKMSDTGIGMRKETISRIFEPYFTTRGESGGSGLGMSVVFGIVKSHQGYIDVTSEFGRGTDVTISFPVSDETYTVAKERTDDIKGGTERILIIDDEKAILKMTKTLLEEFGYDVHTTSSGREGILRVQEQKPDLILLDLKMPDMDGRQVLKELMEIDPNVRVIISTGYVDTEQNDNLIKMGAKGLVKKPFSADTMKREIRRVLGEFK